MAIKKVYELAVDLKKSTTRVNIPVLVQGDSAEFRIRLLDNGAELSTGELNGITAVKMQSGYDAQTVIQTVGTLQGSVAVFRLQKGELFRSGTVQAMVQLEDSADRISTLRFQYQVIADLTGNYIPGEQDLTIFQRYMNDAQAKIDEMAATDVAQLTVKLADTAEMIPNVANGEFILNLLNPYGDFQNIHGKLLVFPNGWNGYKYWLLYTPYPNGNWRFENPCVAVSNDKLNWALPAGLENGILEDWNGVTGAYNNDTHGVFRTDLNRLEVWWRFVDENTDIVHLYRRTTLNGKDWTPRETMFTGNRKGNDHLSPAIVFEDGKYKMLSVNTVGTNRILNYTESVSGSNWGSRTEVVAEWDGLTPWHLDFINEGDKYTIVLQAWEQDKNNNTSSLYFLESTDLINLSKPIKILAPSTSPTAFDNAGIYRSTLIKEGDDYTLIYSAVSKDGKRAMSISQGTQIKALKGIRRELGNLGMNPTVNNLYEVKQTTNPARYGGVMAGNILFANGLLSGVNISSLKEDESAIRWNGTNKVYERYDVEQAKWVTLVSLPSPTQAMLEKDTQQSLVNNEWIEVDFNKVIVNNGGFVGSRFVVPANGAYRFEVNLQLAGLADGDAIEIYLMRNTARVRPLIRQVITPLSGNYFVNNSAFYNLLQGQEMSIVIKYIGTSSSAYITGNATQNALLIERV